MENWKETYMAVLKELLACEDARRKANESTAATFDEFWSSVGRSDWMFWLAARLIDRKVLVRAACACARTTLKFVKPGEDRPRIAIETAEKWTVGQATIEDVSAAAAAASAYAAAASYAADVASSAAAFAAASYAADVASSAAAFASSAAAFAAASYAADVASSAAAFAAAAAAFAADAARDKTKAEIIVIIIREIPASLIWGEIQKRSAK